MGDDVFSSAREAAYDHDSLEISPAGVSVWLKDSGVHIEATPTNRAAVLRFTFPAGKPGRVIFETRFESGIEISPDGHAFSGFTKANNGGVPENFAFRFVAAFDQPVEAVRVLKQEKTEEKSEIRTAIAVDFRASSDSQPLIVEMTLGTSFVSEAQARINLEREIGENKFDAVLAKGRAEWNRVLGQVEIEATPEQTRTFYSCLYRAHLFPQEFHEYDAGGETIHYSPYHGRVVPGVLYTNNGFWDTFRTVYPLLAILDPERVGAMTQGWLNAFDESGWLPQWPSPGQRNCMIGTHSDVVIADAVVKKLPGFDPKKALAAMLKHARTPVDGAPGFGRPGLNDLLELGFIPIGRTHASASVTVDFSYDDFAIAQVARAVGDDALAAEFDMRSVFYKNLFDAETGFLRGRNADGSFPEKFDEFEWGGPYIEACAWQSNWAAQHDHGGMIELYGSGGNFVRKLDAMFSSPQTFRIGSYGYIIHEMTEMTRLPFGQYAHSNQPGHNAPYLFLAAGYPWKTQHWVRRILNEAYSPEGFCGDEDNGEMASWYVQSALGLFPLTPGRPEYVLGSPLVRSARVHLANGKTLRIDAPENAADRPFVGAITLDGKPHDRLWISYDALMAGASLAFTMSDKPVIPTVPWRAEQLPPTVTPFREVDLTPDPALMTAP